MKICSRSTINSLFKLSSWKQRLFRGAECLKRSRRCSASDLALPRKEEALRNITLMMDTLEQTEDVSFINDFLFLGSEDITYDKAAMQRLGITHIINCTKFCENRFSKKNGCSDGFEYLQLHLNDETDQLISEQFQPSFNFIEQARQSGGKCLVHCRKGVSRSASIVIAYLMKFEEKMLIDAMRSARSSRPAVAPNVGFMHQLAMYELALYGKNSLDLIKYSEDRFDAVDCWVVDQTSRQKITLEEFTQGFDYPSVSKRMKRTRSDPYPFPEQ